MIHINIDQVVHTYESNGTYGYNNSFQWADGFGGRTKLRLILRFKC